ncbi:MAG: fibronectin type III domain-containing protein [bacterium]
MTSITTCNSISKFLSSYCKVSIVFVLFISAIFILTASPSYAGLAAASNSSNSVTLTWTAPGDDNNVGTASQYDIRYSTSVINDANWGSVSQVSNEPNPQIAGTAEFFVVENLNPGTTYYFAIRAADEVPNWSVISNIASATTDPEQEAPSDIADLHITNINSTSASLAWTAPGDDGSVGTATEYDIRMSTSPISALNWNFATQLTGEPNPSIAGSSESFVVSNLTPEVTYYFAIKTSDEIPNISGLSNVVSGTTSAEENAPADIDDLIALVSTSSSISISWTAPGDDGSSGTASEYDIRYSTSPITELNWDLATQVTGENAPQAAGSDETFTIEGLALNTAYYIAIKTADEVPNWSGLSNILSASTTGDTTPPAAINDLETTPEG